MYSTSDDLLLEFSPTELAILTGDPTGVTIDQSRISFAIDKADRTIDSYLWGIYDVPFDTTPAYPLIHKLSVDLTIVYLYETAYKDTEVPNTIVWRRIYAIKMLKDLRDGNIKMKELNEADDPSKTIVSNKTGDERIFSDDVLDQFE